MPTCTEASCKEVALQPGQTCLPARKKCSRCKKKKSRAKFTKNKNKPDGLGRYCKLCHHLYDKAYRARRTQEAKERRWARERTPAKRLRDRVGLHRRRLGGGLTVHQVVALFEEFDNRCARCTRHDSEIKGVLQIDHVVPAPEGKNSIENTQPLCGVCNPTKGRKCTDYRPGFPLRRLIAILVSCLNMLPYVPPRSAQSTGRKPCLRTAGRVTANAA